jgi:hypothetical protein
MSEKSKLEEHVNQGTQPPEAIEALVETLAMQAFSLAIKAAVKHGIGYIIYPPDFPASPARFASPQEEEMCRYISKVRELIGSDGSDWDSRIVEYMAEGWSPVTAANYIRALRRVWP